MSLVQECSIQGGQQRQNLEMEEASQFWRTEGLMWHKLGVQLRSRAGRLGGSRGHSDDGGLDLRSVS